MDMTILNSDFEAIYILDTYESFIWVDKMYEPGTFELYTPLTKEILYYVRPDNYIQMKDSDRLMIIEDFSIETDIESGDKIKIIGRSLESILDRRIIWNQTKFNGTNLQTAIAKLLNDSIIAPAIAVRRIPNFAPFTPSENPKIASLKLTSEYTGDNLLEVIQNICNENKIGFKIILNEQKQFVFLLYLGTDRSYQQNENPYVIFSPSFDNIINSTYTDTNSQAKNVTLVAGEGEGSSRKTKVVGSMAGLLRKELYTDARDLQKESLSNAKYLALLANRGIEKLSEANKKRTFDGKCDTKRVYSYGKDFFLGDIVEITNEYGIESAATITEFTWNFSSSGSDTYPTFIAVEDAISTGKNILETTLSTLKTNNTSGTWDGNKWSNSNITITINLDAYDRVSSIDVNGVNSLSSDIQFVLGKVITSDDSELVLSGITNGSSSTYKLSLYDRSSSREIAPCYNGDVSVSSINLTHDNYVYFVIKSKKKAENLILYPMVRLATETNTYEPFDESLQEEN